MVNVKTMAEQAKVSPETIRRYCRMGIIKAERFSGGWMIHCSANEPIKNKPKRGRPRFTRPTKKK